MSTLPPEIAAFDHAQRMTIELMRAVVDSLEVGMSERDVYELALSVLGHTCYHQCAHVEGIGRRRPLPIAQQIWAPWRGLMVAFLACATMATSIWLT